MKKIKLLFPLLFILLLINSCDSYIEFEKGRGKLIVYISVISLIIGLIGMAFSRKE